MKCSAWILLSIGFFIAPAQALDLDDYRLLDLGQPFNKETLYWPTSPSRFELTPLARGETDAGWFYAANALCTPEHGGTHLDAPAHFAAAGLTVDALPLQNLMAPGVVIDVSDQVAIYTDYRVTTQDVEAFEKRYGRIAVGTIVLVRTGWSLFWPDAKRYLGDDTPGDASQLHFPSYGVDAARLLVEDRQVAMLGIDTASIDYGPSKDFPVHRIAAAGNVAGLENLTGLDRLPATGFTVLALPMKIEGGSGGPARVVALVPK